MTAKNATFGVSFGEIFFSGVRGYFAHLAPLSAAGALTLGTYLVFRLQAQAALDADNLLRSILLDLAGLVVASIVAYPWYCYALDAQAGGPVDVGFPWRTFGRLRYQAVASLWFWAGVLLGLRYLLGLPAIVVVIFYAFYGFVVADGAADGGLMALGTSVRISEGRRIGLFAVAGVFFVFNLFGAIALGVTVNALTVALAIAGLVVTTNITMVSGARLYRLLQTGPTKDEKEGTE